MAKKTGAPRIDFTEIDNSIRTVAEPALGIGAIVMKSNKGPVNMRTVSRDYTEFTDIYGTPETTEDYGHFAAEQVLSVNQSQLYAVRAAMGDENYAQIQFPYTNSMDFMNSKSDVEFNYVQSDGTNQLSVGNALSGITSLTALTDNGEWETLPASSDGYNFAVRQGAKTAVIEDLLDDSPSKQVIFKVNNRFKPNTGISSDGMYVEYVNALTNDGRVTSKEDDLIFTSDAWSTSGIDKSTFVATTDSYFKNSAGTASGINVMFPIPEEMTLDGYAKTATMTMNWKTYSESIKSTTPSTIKLTDLFNTSAIYNPQEVDVITTYNASKISLLDWDDTQTKEYYVNTSAFNNTLNEVKAIEYVEYGMNDNSESLVVSGMPVSVMTSVDYSLAQKLAIEQYACEPEELIKDDLLYFSYLEPGNDTNTEKVVKANKGSFGNSDVELYDWLFWKLFDKNTKAIKTVSVYTAENPSLVTLPWQDGSVGSDGESITKLSTIPTSEITNGVLDRYKDGYTLTISNEDEAGIGDIELYNSNKKNQLVIASIGPGKYGNNVGVSVITTECADIPALNGDPMFNWKYKYDDEDLVDEDIADYDYTWKKVFRINVYVKSDSQTAEYAWGSGLDALSKSPEESFYVSCDPNAVDAEGNSLYAPAVINGISDYIYVSLNSCGGAKNSVGSFVQPRQTYGIYGLTGGSNSKKNLMTEKTAALKLYQDTQRVEELDFIFNVEAIDTFNGKQRYMAHQKTIANIAAERKMCSGIVQVTSKEAKSIKRMVSEAKMFSFNNGSYVYQYAGYDKYHNGDIGAWVYLPKSIAAAMLNLQCMVSQPWMAPAGLSRGTIDFSSGQLYRTSDYENGQLYDINVNFSRKYGNYGEIMNGQKTSLKKDSKLNRINVRNNLNYIEKRLKFMLLPYLFETNNTNTRSSAFNTLDLFFNGLVASGSLDRYDHSVTEDVNDPNVLNVNINLWPTSVIEFIDVKIFINRTNNTITITDNL